MQANFFNILKEKKLKATTTRIELLKLIESFDSAIPLSIIQKEMKSTDRVTLYRTIKILSEKGIIHQVYSYNKEYYYSLCNIKYDIKHNHIHFKCKKCKQITCQDLQENILISIPKFHIEKINISVEGICNNCN